MTNDDRPEPPSLFTDEDPDAGECARSREIAAASSLDLREQLDGVTGSEPCRAWW
jgi:hypothetical protein